MFIEIMKNIDVVIGKQNKGHPLKFPEGRYLYVGSATGTTSTSLSQRLARHCIRRIGAPQPVLKDLAEVIGKLGFPFRIPRSKSLRWHVDYLLEDTRVTLTNIFFEMSQRGNEREWVDLLWNSDHVVPFGKGFGGSDDKGRTHLFQMKEQTNMKKLLDEFR